MLHWHDGAASILRDLRFVNAAAAQTAISDYKALVCILLNGGNDGNNLILPTMQADYDAYAAIRTPILAIPQSAILPICPLNNDGHSYGLHPSCPELQTCLERASWRCCLTSAPSLIRSPPHSSMPALFPHHP